MKDTLKSILYLFFKLIYKQYQPNKQGLKWLFLTTFTQKIVGINRSVPWPVHFSSYVKGYENIISKTELVGEAMGNYIDGRNGIILEENVWIGPKVSIISQNHDENNFEKFIETKPIIIRKNCLLLTNCVILPEVELGEHTIVAAGAVVTKSFLEGNQIIGGVPAKIIKKLGNYQAII
jgi:acetyltransferase-like isoleucine patch superfamily enzyme